MLTDQQIAQLYQNVLYREPTQVETQSARAQNSSEADLTDTLVNSSEANDIITPIVLFYEAVFGRVPDKAGLDNWADFVRDEVAQGKTTEQALESFADNAVQSQEFINSYGDLSAGGAERLVRDLYNRLLGREPEAEGLNFWRDFVQRDVGEAISAFVVIVDDLGIQDAAVDSFLRSSANGTQDYSGRLADTNNDGQIDGNDGGGEGSKYGLTQGTDYVTGTSADDFISGAESGTTTSQVEEPQTPNTLTTQDTILAGTGKDTVVADLGPGTQAPTIENAERLFIDGAGSTLDLANVKGANEIWALRTDLFVENASLGTTFGVRNLESGTLTVDFTETPSGPNDVLKLASDDANATIKSSTDAQTSAIEAIELFVTGAGREDKVDVSDYNNVSRVTVSGDSDVILTVSPSSLTTIDATANTGGVTIDETNSASQAITADGGAGNDVFKTGIGDDTVRGGAGDDELIVGGGDNDVDGGAGNDVIKAEGGNDTLNGGAGDDQIDAGSGKDTLDGGAGADTMTGGGAGDVFSIEVSSVMQEATLDTITDFNSELVDDQDRFTFGGPEGTAANYAEAQAAGDAYGDIMTKADELLGEGTIYAAVRDASGNNTFVFHDANASGTLDAGDAGVKLMGLSQLDGSGGNGVSEFDII